MAISIVRKHLHCLSCILGVFFFEYRYCKIPCPATDSSTNATISNKKLDISQHTLFTKLWKLKQRFNFFVEFQYQLFSDVPTQLDKGASSTLWLEALFFFTAKTGQSSWNVSKAPLSSQFGTLRTFTDMIQPTKGPLYFYFFIFDNRQTNLISARHVFQGINKLSFWILLCVRKTPHWENANLTNKYMHAHTPGTRQHPNLKQPRTANYSGPCIPQRVLTAATCLSSWLPATRRETWQRQTAIPSHGEREKGKWSSWASLRRPLQ